MSRNWLAGLGLVGLTLSPLWAHGGTYPGPGDIVPPGAGGGGGGGGAGAPPGPGPAPGAPPGTGGGPTTGGPAFGPGLGGGAGSSNPSGVTSRPVADAEDLTSWEFWWGVNREVYLGLRAAIHDRAPSTGDGDWYIGTGQVEQGQASAAPPMEVVHGEVVPALLKALETERQDDVLTGAMIALARIGGRLDEDGRSRVRDAIREHLTAASQEVRETAVLSLGIFRDEASAPFLAAVFADREEAHRALRTTSVPSRTRAFAGFALTLIGRASSDPDLRREIVHEAARVLELPNQATRDLKVAAMMTFGLVPLEPAPLDLAPGTPGLLPGSRQEQIRFLLDHLDPALQRRDAKRRADVVRAHVPRALARLLAADGQRFEDHEVLREEVADMLIGILDARSSESSDLVREGAALALGQVGTAGSTALDARIVDALRTATRTGSQPTRRFAMIALAQVGSRPGPGADAWARVDEVRGHLAGLHSRAKTNTRAWTALALGVFGHHLREADQLPATDVTRALITAAAKEGNPETIGAYAIALGLREDVEGIPTLLERMDDLSGLDGPRGYCAVGLGMLRAEEAAEPVLEVVRASKYRPELLRQSATGLALMRRTHTVPVLLEMLQTTEAMATQAALCGALGRIGDRTSVEPLLELLADNGETASTRGFAAVALGVVCDPAPLPWAVELARDVPYLAATATLVGQGAGLLDLF